MALLREAARGGESLQGGHNRQVLCPGWMVKQLGKNIKNDPDFTGCPADPYDSPGKKKVTPGDFRI